MNSEVTVRSVTEVGADTVALDLESPDGFDAVPGQFVKLTARVDGEHVSRFYTLSSPDVGETFEVTVGVDPEGDLGPWLADSEGGTVRIEGPFGSAHYEGERESLVLAGGPGVGPAVGIGERALADGNEVTIVYRDDEPVHRERLDALEDEGVTVEFLDEAEALEPVVREHLDGGQVFVYGFQAFVTEAVDAVEAAGGESDDAKVENFG
jgi:ferredoxin-NADP reductase